MIFKNAELYNVNSLKECGDGFEMSRLPESACSALNPLAQSMVKNGCGCEIRFNLGSGNAVIEFAPSSFEGWSSFAAVEVYFGSFQASYTQTPQYLGPGMTSVTVALPQTIDQLEEIAKKINLPFDPRLVRILLPYDKALRIRDIQGDISLPRADQTPSLRWLAYGSSITHGSCAPVPSCTYTYQVASLLKADVINMGFAGSAMLDEAVASYFAGRKDWNFATLEMGINVYDQWNTEQYSAAARRFLDIFIKESAGRTIFCTDMFAFYPDFFSPGKAVSYRTALREIVLSVGDNIVYIDGRSLLGNFGELSTDLVHPSSAGMREIAANLAAALRAFDLHS